MRKLVQEILEEIKTGKNPNTIKRNISKKHKLPKLITNADIISNLTDLEREKYASYFLTKPSRTGSGVIPVAIMTKPFQCPHVKKGIGPCIMCPGGPSSYFGDVPQSYTGNEPAARRALRQNFNPYMQTFNRLEQYILLGNIPEKIQFIIMGGTFPATPVNYQKEFITQAFKALNDFSKLFFKKRFEYEKFKKFFELPGTIDDKDRLNSIQNKLKKLNKKSNLEKEQRINEKAKIRCIGLVIETRPDYSNLKEANLMLELGCTSVELGIQSVYDSVLQASKRGHSVQDSVNAIRTLKDLGFKINTHYMLGLPSSTKEMDLQGLQTLFTDGNFRPDMLKIYPCLITKGTELYNLWKNNKYLPMKNEEAIKIISEFKKTIPTYVRIMRIQRDIAENLVEAGVFKTNLRQYVQNELKNQGLTCNCIRCRELKDKDDLKNIKPLIKEYAASEGKEYFISFENIKKNKIAGFCRLRIPSQELRKEITKNSAIVRELHVYGNQTSIGEEGDIQHKGLGKKLLKIAEKLSRQNKKSKLVIISGIGVREYYKKLGYKKEGQYMIKNLPQKC